MSENHTAPNNEPIPICDYEGSDYQTRFWQNQGREYEDLVERTAIRHLLPAHGKRLLEIGAGFGRLADMYQGYEQIVLLDYSKSLLRQAQERLGNDPKYTYIAANIYQLPLDNSQADAVCMIRVIHHLVDVPQALAQIHRILCADGIFLLEFANKLNWKAILRYAAHRQTWSPFDLAPVEFVPLNFDFHPRWMRTQLAQHGFEIQRTRTLSHLRIPLLKRLIPARILAALDGICQPSGQWWQLTPSVITRSRRKDTAAHYPPEQLVFQCPSCKNTRWRATTTEMHCLACHTRWSIDDGIYDFKTPLPDRH